MTAVLQSIDELRNTKNITKQEQIVMGVINAINEKKVTHNDPLPSVSHLIRHTNFSRDTVFKAYSELKNRGIIEAKNRQGYFVASTQTNQYLKVALILYAFHPFQEAFYERFKQKLGADIQIDMFFHHGNMEVFKTIWNNIVNAYGMYVVAPIQNKESIALLQQVAPPKLLIVDRFLPLGKHYPYVVQNFDETLFDSLLQLKEAIVKFDECVLLYENDKNLPQGVVKGYEKFVAAIGYRSKIYPRYEAGMVRKGAVFIINNDNDLFQVARAIQQEHLTLGVDVGIVSQNESILKEVLMDGITTISSDFIKMADMAAAYVLDLEMVQTTIPTELTLRNSLY